MQGSFENVQQAQPDKSIAMNKRQQISFWKQQLKSSEEMKQVANQNYNLAARLETAAKSALNELGAQKGQGRKVKHELSEKDRIALIGNLTSGSNGKRN